MEGMKIFKRTNITTTSMTDMMAIRSPRVNTNGFLLFFIA